MTLHPKFITDKDGKKSAVVLPIKKYDKLLEELEDIDDARAYEQAKKEDDGYRIDFGEYLKQRKAKNG